MNLIRKKIGFQKPVPFREIIIIVEETDWSDIRSNCMLKYTSSRQSSLNFLQLAYNSFWYSYH